MSRIPVLMRRWLALLLAPGLAFVGPSVGEAADVEAESGIPTVAFDDTDNGDGVEWRIQTFNVGERFFVEDVLAGNEVFRLFQNSPENSLVVQPDGGTGVAIGIGGIPTANTLELFSDALPEIMFHDTSATPYLWEVEADVEAFKVLDDVVFTIPFRSDAGAAHNSIRVRNNGFVGHGIETPLFPLHVVRNAGGNSRIAQFTYSQPNGTAVVGFENSAPANAANEGGFDFVVRSSTQPRTAGRLVCNFTNIVDAARTSSFSFQTANAGVFGEAMKITGTRVSIGTAAAVQLLTVGNATCNGNTWTDACSRELKQDITSLSPDAARAAVLSLAPVTYTYKDDPTDPRVGFIAEDAPELVATPDRRGLSSLDIVAALTKVVQEQDRELSALRTQLADQDRTHRAELDEIRRLLEAIGSQQQ